ncbi:PilZ domain-containing protein [Dasania sp. GY-MA-18]|uniref:PilZ domain-containing protein n=1 Tax=Dasania phycosphaerae TaxID=2950436 RepID=A0A9J6RJS8_9GAMM|nr:MULTISPECIES: PilZ domain-containing protein [Dasania]MCR8922230.1 PilZ domain-containing protein [Dasania sp. GY-MA-18]MCZ0864658.1 PilZ domain-containing protein [Dasania phycosphaerae]MCZ0868386.1 PilZ domain-containing protein [Dasania phycosphaerae]
MNNNEKRSESRVSEQATIFVETYSSGSFGGTKVVICNSLDISANGLQFQMDEKPELGSILRLFAEFNDQQAPMQLIGEVKWVVPQGQDFNIGFAIYDAEDTDIIQWKQLIAQRLQPEDNA